MLIPLRLITQQSIKNTLSNSKYHKYVPVYNKFFSSKTTSEVTDDQQTIQIGDVTKTIKSAKNPELIPQKYGKHLV